MDGWRWPAVVDGLVLPWKFGQYVGMDFGLDFGLAQDRSC